MRNQGFTADVSCEYRELNANTTPSLFFLSDETNEWRSGSTTPLINFSEMNSDCVVPVGSGRELTLFFLRSRSIYNAMQSMTPLSIQQAIQTSF